MSFSSPILVAGDQSRALPRIPLASSGGAFSEAWLQRQLFKHPEALPLKEIAPHLGAVAPVCMELNTVAGPADILYVTETGQIVLTETKLWRNPEARRTVVAQILDYAKELASWRYEDLQREVARASGKGPGFLLEAVRARFPTLDEQVFVDGINHSLRTGDLVLLIVGDGIRSGTESLVGFLERYGSLRFSFGLIEVAAFEVCDGMLLLPRVLAKTEILRRTVVVATDVAGAELPAPSAPGPGGETEVEWESGQPEQAEYAEWLLGFWQDYMARLRLDDQMQPFPTKPPRGTNAYFPINRDTWLSAYLARSWDHVGVYLTFNRKYDRAAEIFEHLQGEREAIEKEIGEPLDWVSRSDGTRSVTLTHALGDWRDPAVREKHLRFLTGATNRFVNAFRPRVLAILRQENS